MTSGNRKNIFPRGAFPRRKSRSHKTASSNHVKKIVSGPPASICIAPAKAARKIFLPPSRHAISTANTTHGIQLKVAMWLGHISKFNVSPLKEKAVPAKAAAKLFSVQCRARKNIPIPANHKWSRQKKLNDHCSG